jgi:D-threo-aldose 1-dehydrogenase
LSRKSGRKHAEGHLVKQVVIPGTDLSVSRFIFGTGSLFNTGSSRSRRELLSAAYDSGFTHFDTAPYYGFGWAERDLSDLLAAHPDATVTTKVGIYSPGGEWQSELSILLRKAGGHVRRAISRATADWSITRARLSLDQSLRRLGRGHVDFYALHEPNAALIQTDEWLRWLEDEVAAGRIRYYGFAGNAGRLKSLLEDSNPLAKVVQTADSLDGREADVLSTVGKPFQITYGYVSAAMRTGGGDVQEVLSCALERNRHGAIIVSTRRKWRLSQYQNILDKSQPRLLTA